VQLITLAILIFGLYATTMHRRSTPTGGLHRGLRFFVFHSVL
jgi:hypothetical protein